MARPDAPSTPDQWLNGPIAKSDNGGRGIGPTLGMDASIEHEREELARCLEENTRPANLETGTGTTGVAPRATVGEGPGADTGFTQSGGPQSAATVSEAPDQSQPAAGVEMQPPAEAAELDSGTYGGGAGAEVRRETRSFMPDLNDSVLKSPGAGGAGHDFGTGPTAGDVGGANAAGFSASLGQGDAAPPEFSPPGGDQPLSDNEQQDSRKAHGLAQGGAGPSETAPDQTRAEGNFGSINNTEGP